MSVCWTIPDLEFEELFKKIRFAILSHSLVINETSPELLRFQSALALQCFTNEYIYNYGCGRKKVTPRATKKCKKSF